MMLRSFITVTIVVVVVLATTEAGPWVEIQQSGHRLHTHLELFQNGSMDIEALWNEFKTVYGKNRFSFIQCSVIFVINIAYKSISYNIFILLL